MNVLLTPFVREEKIPEPLLPGLRSYNSNDGFVRAVGDQLNFAAPSEDEAEYPTGAYLKKGKVSRQDPLSHRIIEKRRRDRMNNCLADLSRLIPPEYLKKGRGRVEKTEIIEMAIRHLKYLQDRANAADRQSEDTFRAGYQEAVTEAVRFLVEVHGYGHGDGLCGSLASHLQRHVEVKGGRHPCETARPHRGFSSETTSSSSSSGGSLGYGAPPPGAPPPAAPLAGRYDGLADHYGMDCERVTLNQNPVPMESEILPEDEPVPLDARKNSPSLRAVRKPDHAEDYLQSYKFKNSIERRFSRSQDNEACDMSRSGGAPPGKLYSHKRRRAARPAPPPLPASASTSTEETRDTSPQDTSNESSASQHHHYDKPALPTQYVPVFALNEIGKYYVPMSVEPACLARQCGALQPRAARREPLHPVTIHVSFQPCRGYVKREPDHPDEQDWRPA